ncbi:MAG: DUF4912 domain-containing protein [Candidatus Omnitrophica bacterium]|nr:DUF4912 domain-containing protein [Candidatus Omnitrophota bacterium]
MARSLGVSGRYLLTKPKLIRAIERKMRERDRSAGPWKKTARTKPQPSPPLPARRSPRTASYSRGLKARGAAAAGKGGIVPVPAPQPSSGMVVDYSLPERYGMTLIVAQARDPHWLHAYWEITPEDYKQARARLGGAGNNTLRAYELSEGSFSDRSIRRWFDVETGDASDWFLEVGCPASWWCLEIGIGKDGRFVSIARSNVVVTPADRPSDEIDEQWGTLGEEFFSRYGLGAPGTSPGTPRWGPPRP